MNDHDKIIQLFLTKYNLTEENSEIIGILFYGSRNYNTHSKESDIDLLIITNSPNNYKGTTYINDIKIEYTQKNICDLLDEIEHLDTSSNRYLVSTFTNGTIVYSKDQTLQYLKEEILNKSKIKKTTKQRTNNIELIDWYLYFNSINSENKLFEYTYHNLLENIRKYHHDKKGYSSIPDMKVYQLYTDKKYASKYYCVTLPEQEFIDKYLELISSKKKKEDIFKLIDELIDYNMDGEYEFNHYSKKALRYKSTTIYNSVSKCCNFIETNHPCSNHYYYITLEKIRKLYCNINDINEKIENFGYDYDNKFLDLFISCLEGKNRKENIKNLFYYVSNPLNIDYKNYKVLVTHN